MKGIELRFEKRLGSFSLSVDLAIPGRGITALFGHSGSGKTTLLRLIAGLERCEGHLMIKDEVWQDAEIFRPPHRRPVGYVFQEASLFPHLNVLRNLEYGFKRVPRHEQRVSLEEAVALLGIESLLYRSPVNLSGGERQRVAIARALLTSPRVLLMDEPLAALDEQRKQEILPFLERMHDELDIPVLYVSHSLREVARLADHMVWMEAGRVIGHGALSDVLARVDLEQAWEEEAGAVVAATVAFHDDSDHLTALETHCGRLWVRRMEVEPGRRVRVRLPARDISLSLEPDRRSSILNVWQVVVEQVEEAGPGQALVRMRCRAGGPMVIARITARSLRVLGLCPGQTVYARMKSVALLV